MSVPRNLRARTQQVAGDLRRAMSRAGGGLAAAVLTIARVEYPMLDPEPYLHIIDSLDELTPALIRALHAP